MRVATSRCHTRGTNWSPCFVRAVGRVDLVSSAEDGLRRFPNNTSLTRSCHGILGRPEITSPSVRESHSNRVRI